MTPALSGVPHATELLALSLGVWFIFELRQSFNRRAGATSGDRGSLMALRVLGVTGALLASLALQVPAAAYPYSSWTFAMSLAIVWSGIVLRWWSFRTLGRYFTFTVMTSADQPVITTGPYRLLRHPSYAGLLLVLGGIGLTYGNWLSLLALTVIPLLGFVYRIRVEEAALSATLGDAYTSYARGRKRLIPFVW